MSAHELTEADVDRLLAQHTGCRVRLAQHMGCRVRCVCGALQSIRVDAGHVRRRCSVCKRELVLREHVGALRAAWRLQSLVPRMVEGLHLAQFGPASLMFRELAQDMVNQTQHQQSRPPSREFRLKCDHKFVEAGACKCGWRPLTFLRLVTLSAVELDSRALLRKRCEREIRARVACRCGSKQLIRADVGCTKRRCGACRRVLITREQLLALRVMWTLESGEYDAGGYRITSRLCSEVAQAMTNETQNDDQTEVRS